MPTDSILKTAQQRVVEKLAARQQVDVKAISPDMLMLVLEAVLLVIERCLANSRAEDVAQQIHTPGLLGELAARHGVRRVMRETYGPFGFYRHGGAELVQALLEAGHEASIEERNELVRHIRNQLS